MTPTLDVNLITEALLTSRYPWTGVDVHAELASTNAEAIRVGRSWHVVTANHQTAGRGRLGRVWEDTAGTSIAVSAVLPAPAERREWLPLVTGLALKWAIAEVTGVQTSLKWPNDVLADAGSGGEAGRKLCGVLCEMTPVGVVVGAGVNVSQTREQLPVPTATSLQLCGAGDVQREPLITAYLLQLADLHDHLTGSRADADGVRDAYRAACRTIGSEVDLHRPSGEVQRATATGVDGQGRLIVQTPHGEDAVAAGDVVHVRGPA